MSTIKIITKQKTTYNGGVSAQKGFRFQHYYSLYKILILHKKDIDYKAILEGEEDLDLYVNSTVEMYQMKTDKALSYQKIAKIIEDGRGRLALHKGNSILSDSKNAKWHLVVNGDNVSPAIKKIIDQHDIETNILNIKDKGCIFNDKEHNEYMFIIKTRILSDDNDKEDVNNGIVDYCIKDVLKSITSLKYNANTFTFSELDYIRLLLLNVISSKSSSKNTESRSISKQEADLLISDCVKSSQKNMEKIKDELRSILKKKDLDSDIPLYIQDYNTFKQKALAVLGNANFQHIKSAIIGMINTNITNTYQHIPNIDSMEQFKIVITEITQYIDRINFDINDIKMLAIEEYIKSTL